MSTTLHVAVATRAQPWAQDLDVVEYFRSCVFFLGAMYSQIKHTGLKVPIQGVHEGQGTWPLWVSKLENIWVCSPAKPHVRLSCAHVRIYFGPKVPT